MKRVTLAIIAIILIIIGFVMIATGQENNIDINTDDEKISVVESFKAEIDSNHTLNIWIQTGASNLEISIDGTIQNTDSTTGNIYSVNISNLDFTVDNNVVVKYDLSADTTSFEKTLQYDMNTYKIDYDGNTIFTADNLKEGSKIDVELVKPTTGETKIVEKIVETIPTWIYIVIAALAIVIVLLLVKPSQKQSSSTKKDTASGSEEFFKTKKTLLMSVLKDIEKQHRAKKISDDTYHKLKDQYKQEAVNAMKKLEDMSS